MPGSQKDLYLASSLEELNTQIAVKPTIDSLEKLMKSSVKLRIQAEHSEMLGDEEKAYIFYMRYLDIVTYAKKVKSQSKSVKKVPHIDEKVLMEVLTKAEKLSESLKIRYNDRLNKKNLEKNPKITPVVKDNVTCIETDSSIPNGLLIKGRSILPLTVNKIEVNESKTSQSNDSITSTQLYRLLHDDNESVTVFDVRSISDFVKSKMKCVSCVSVPEDILRPGITAQAIEKLLPDESKHLWMNRDKVDYIVLMDWNSSLMTLKENSPLHSLREALTRWSTKTFLKSDPFILENGYEDWILHYPSETTNPNVKKYNSSLDTSSALLLSLDVDYPDPDMNEINETNLNIETIDLTDENTTIPSSKSMSNRRDSIIKIPSVDRALKPLVIVNKPEPKPAWPSEKRAMDAKKEIDDSYDRLETMTEEQLRNTMDRLNKEHEFAMLCMRKESEASEEMRKIMTEEAEQVIVKINSLEMENKSLEEGRRILEEENRKLRKKLTHQPDDISQTQAIIKDKLEEKRKRDAEVEKLRNDRKRKEASKHESKPKSFKDSNIGDTNKNLETKGEFKTTLKDEPFESKRGLRRSLSSPNIAQLVENTAKLDINSSINTPIVNRQVKPTILNQSIPPVNRILKPNETAVVKQRNFNPVYTSQGNSQTGLRNLGNTCFMNSVIQCLANTNGLVDYLVYRDYSSDVRDSGSKGEVVEELSILLQHLRGGSRSITPSDFKNIVSRYLKICIGNEQQDAHEFLTKLMEKLHMEVNRGSSSSKLPPPETDKLPVSEGIRTYWKWHTTRNDSAIQDIFEGLLLSQLTCLHCKSVSNSYEVFSCLSVPISSTSRCSLDSCVKNFLKPERISGDAGWNCPTCKQKREAEKQMYIVKLPKVLVIHLKRFSYEGMWRSKLKTMVTFPLTNLDMTNYISDQCKAFQSSYSLYGVVNHFGTLEGGHYIAICKSRNEKWYKYDDQDVSEISASSVATDAAYIMFYNMVSS